MKKLIILAALALAACSTPKPEILIQTQRVEVPVAVRRDPPAELLGPVFGPDALPTFVAPSDPAATSALTPAGEKSLRALINALRIRVNGWTAWAAEK